ncbi:MAG: flagellar hook-length control protein FliK [Sarcina sp.]
MRSNMVNRVVEVDLTKNISKKDNKNTNKYSEEKSFEKILSDRQVAEKEKDAKVLKGKSKEKKSNLTDSTELDKAKTVDSTELDKTKPVDKEIEKNVETDFDKKIEEKVEAFENIDTQIESINIENPNIQIENIDLESLLSLLLLVSGEKTANKEVNIANIDTINFQNNKSFINEIKETLNQVPLEEKIGKLDLGNLEEKIFENVDRKNPLANLLGEMKLLNKTESLTLEEIKGANFKELVVQELDEEVLGSRDVKNSNVKEIIVQVLNEKGLSNEDIKKLSLSLKSLENSEGFKKSGTFREVNSNANANDEVIPRVNQELQSKQITSGEFKQSDSKESSSNQSETSKDDKFLSKFLTEDKSVFDMNMQRIKDLSNIQEGSSKISINKETMLRDIKDTVVHMTKINMKELVVKVNPGNLGEISIKLIAEADSMKAVIKVSSKETYALISGQDIKQYLGSENIKISDVEIELYKDDTTFFNDSNEFMDGEDSRRNYNNSSKNEFMEIEDEVEEEMTISSLDIII